MRKLFISIAVTAILGFLLLRVVSPLEIAEGVRNIRWQFFAAAFLGYTATNILRAERFSLIFGRRISAITLLPIVWLTNFFNVVLPFRLGEFSFLHLVNKTGVVGIGKNVAGLVAARLLDAVCIIILFLAFLSAASARVVSLNAVAIAGIITLLFLIAIFLLFLFGGRFLVRFVERLIERPSRFFQFLVHLPRYLREWMEEFAALRAARLLFPLLLYSFLIWFLTFLNGTLLLRGAGISLSPDAALVVYAFPVFASMAPIGGILGIGAYEASVALGLILFGIAQEHAVLAGFVLHIEELLFVIFFGIFGYGIRFFSRKGI